MRLRRVSAALAVATLTALCLSGCTSTTEGVLGLTIVDGRVEALFAMCPGGTSDEIHMIPAHGQFFLIPHPSWKFDPAVSDSIDLGTTKDFLDIVGGDVQGIQTSSSTGVGGYLRFKASDIQGLHDGEILVGSPTSTANLKVDLDGFGESLAELCDSNI
jgi:hypothetical protein